MSDRHFADLSLEFNRHIVNLIDSLSALSDLAQLSINTMDEASLLKQALAALMANQDMERCSIFLLDQDDALVCAAGLDWEEMLRGISHIPPAAAPARSSKCYRRGEGLMGKAVSDAAIQHCRSCAEDARFQQDASGVPVQGSLLCVPILCESRVLGVLNVFYPLADFFNMWHERLLLLFCQSLGRLLANHRLTHQLNREVDRTSAALAREQSFLQSVLDSAPEPMMVIGRDYRLMMTNQAARNMAMPISVASRCHEISHQRATPCDGVEHPCPLQQVLAEERIVTVVHEHFNAAGTARLVELMASPLRDASGSIIGIIESARDVTELKQAEEKIRQLAYYDTLTGLPNRRLLLDRLNHALVQAKRFERAMAVLFLDLDRFKQINDTFGHSIGDALLKQVAVRLSTCVREGDTVARPGGDEFVIVLTEIAHSQDAARVAEKIIASFATPIPVADRLLTITTSIGIALHPVNGTDDVEELMKKADTAMYAAKEAGRNAYRFSRPTP